MALTDYIAPDTLREAGYIYKDNIDEMLNCIGIEALQQRGLLHADKLRGVMLSVNKAAQVIGIHPTTLQSYIDAGLATTDHNGRISLLAALTFDYTEAKRQMLSQKTHTKNKRIKRTNL